MTETTYTIPFHMYGNFQSRMPDADISDEMDALVVKKVGEAMNTITADILDPARGVIDTRLSMAMLAFMSGAMVWAQSGGDLHKLQIHRNLFMDMIDVEIRIQANGAAERAHAAKKKLS